MNGRVAYILNTDRNSLVKVRVFYKKIRFIERTGGTVDLASAYHIGRNKLEILRQVLKTKNDDLIASTKRYKDSCEYATNYLTRLQKDIAKITQQIDREKAQKE